ncbi:MAG: endonuclease III [Omnitrophica bacterium]|nr:endonuclease III [Candidatus Omnitrophota bacterium]
MLKEKALKVVSRLKKEYPATRTFLNFKNPLQLLVATILSAQCTDRQVNLVTSQLFRKYRSLKDYARADLNKLRREVHSTGLFRNKARNILMAAKKILDDFNGKVPDSLDKLVQLPGVARKTANIVLYNAFGKVEGIAVDTHVSRLSQRLELSDNQNRDKIEKDLMCLLPQKEWGCLNHLLVQHGREICRSRKPKCLQCVLKSICPGKKAFFF